MFNNVRDPYELPDFWPPKSPDLNPVITNSGTARVYQKKCRM